MEDLITKFTDYLFDIGLLDKTKAKTELFILKRRYALLEKEAKEENPDLDLNSEGVLEFFIEKSKDILTDFFEERAEEVTEGIIDRWAEKVEENNRQKQQINELRGMHAYKILNQICKNKARESFISILEYSNSQKNKKRDSLFEEEHEKRIVGECYIYCIDYVA